MADNNTCIQSSVKHYSRVIKKFSDSNPGFLQFSQNDYGKDTACCLFLKIHACTQPIENRNKNTRKWAENLHEPLFMGDQLVVAQEYGDTEYKFGKLIAEY